MMWWTWQIIEHLLAVIGGAAIVFTLWDEWNNRRRRRRQFKL